MSFFTRVFGLFGQKHEEQQNKTQQKSEVQQNPPITEPPVQHKSNHELRENSTVEEPKLKQKPSQNRSRDEDLTGKSKKFRKKKSKENVIAPSLSKPQAPSPALPDSKAPPSSDNSTKKKFPNIFKRTKNPENLKEPGENSNDEVPKLKQKPSQNRSKDEDLTGKSKKLKKKKSKENLIDPSPSTPKLPSSAAPDSKAPSSSDNSTKKKFKNIFRRAKSPENVKEPTGASIGDAANKEAKVKKGKVKDGKKPVRRLRLSDDIFPKVLPHAATESTPHVRQKNVKHIRTTKSTPEQQRSMLLEPTVTESPTVKEGGEKHVQQQHHKNIQNKKKHSNRKHEKKEKNVKDPSSLENDIILEQPNASPSIGQTSNGKKFEELPLLEPPELKDQGSLRGVILDREEVNRMISELKVEDREPSNIVHDPWLPLSELLARSNDIYSDERARKNAALTYEKFVDYELRSSKSTKAESGGGSKKNVSIYPTIDREHFDVNTRLSTGVKDSTIVQNHLPGTNHPDNKN